MTLFKIDFYELTQVPIFPKYISEKLSKIKNNFLGKISVNSENLSPKHKEGLEKYTFKNIADIQK